MSFWVVPWSWSSGHALLLGGDDVQRQQPGGGRVDRHRRVHLVQRDAVQQRPHVALVGDRDADLADLAAGELVVGVIAGLGRQVERDRQARLALLEVAPVELVGAPCVRMPRVGTHHPRPIGLGQAGVKLSPTSRPIVWKGLLPCGGTLGTVKPMPDQSSAATEHAIIAGDHRAACDAAGRSGLARRGRRTSRSRCAATTASPSTLT